MKKTTKRKKPASSVKSSRSNKTLITNNKTRKPPVSPLHKKTERPSNREFENLEIESYKYEHNPGKYSEDKANDVENSEGLYDNESMQEDIEEDISGKRRFEDYPLERINESDDHYRYYDQTVDDRVPSMMNQSRYGEHHSQNYPYYSQDLSDTYREGLHSENPDVTASKNRPYRMTVNRRARLKDRQRRKRENREFYRAQKKKLFPSKGDENWIRDIHKHPKFVADTVINWDPVEKFVNRDLLKGKDDDDLYIRVGDDYYYPGYEYEYASPRRNIRSVNIHRGHENHPLTMSDENFVGSIEPEPLIEKDQYNIRRKGLSRPSDFPNGKERYYVNKLEHGKRRGVPGARNFPEFKDRHVRSKIKSGTKEHEANNELKKVSARKGGREKSIAARKNQLARTPGHIME